MQDERVPPVAAGKWSAAVLAARETPERLRRTMEAIWASTSPPPLLDVVVNGNAALGQSIAEFVQTRPIPTGQTVRVWSIAVGDKANAWNQYVHRLWIGAGQVYFVDGYVSVLPDTFAILNRELGDSDDYVLAIAPMPRQGRSARALRRQMEAEGGIHGNLYGLKENTLRRLKAMPFRLPLGIYRTDPTIGAVFAHGMDPTLKEWDMRGRVRVCGQTSWETDRRTWWRVGTIGDQVKRMLRQAQGMLENAALRQHISERRIPPAQLPATTRELVFDWIAARPGRARRLFLFHPLTLIALRGLAKPRDWSDENLTPRLLFEK